MKKMTYFVMALALVLGLAQCKKEQIEPQNEGNSVMITLDVDGGNNNGSRAEVVPPHVNFKEHDTILVVSDRKYVGYLVHNGTNFSGGITNPTVGKPLYFYFLGNKVQVSTLTPGTTDECTVNISDQTDMNNMPVISMGKSTVNYSSGTDSYSSRLYNKASLMKFNVTTDSDAAICITGMNNEVTVDFSDPTDSGFTYDMNTTDGGLIKMASGAGSPAVKWAIVLPQPALTETGEAYSEDQSYIGTRPTIHAIESNKYYSEGADVISMTVNTHVWNGNLSILTGNEQDGFATARNGMTVYGTLAANVKVSIADGANVTLNNANITCLTDEGDWAGLTCEGDATITLEGESFVKSGAGIDGSYTFCFHPGIEIPEDKTLTINGSGAINASCYNVNPEPSKRWGSGAGIGGVYNTDCGNIIIESGTVIAEGGAGAAGIGSGMGGSIGNITIYGGTVTAKGGDGGAGIGCGFGNRPAGNTCSSCGNITISGGNVTATGGQWAAGIGSGIAYGYGQSSASGFSTSTCGDISITGGTVVATGGGAGSIQGLGGLSYTDYCDGGAGIGTGASVDKSIAGDNAYNSRAGKSSCGNITIGSGVTSVTATKGSDAENSIGKNHSNNQGTCGTVNIGGTVYSNGATPNQSDGATYTYPAPAEQIVDLSTLTAAYTAMDDVILTGTLSAKVRISIADGVTVTLRNVTINGTSSSSYKWAGLTCEGDATIILEGSNTVKGFYDEYPGIQVAQGHTLTIQGSGSLTASSTPSPATSIGYAAGIGGGWNSDISCGNIVINSGNITAIGANNCAGIGGGRQGSCGNITINGGNIEATGGNQGAGIGGGTSSSCGNITINGGHIIATGGDYAAGIGGGSTATSSCGIITINGGSGEATKGDNAQHSIGAGYQSSCGTVTINGVTGYISTSPYSWSL